MRYRVTVLENANSTEYLVDEIIESKQKPMTVVKRYLRKYPNAYCVEAMQDTTLRTYGASISSCLRA